MSHPPSPSQVELLAVGEMPSEADLEAMCWLLAGWPDDEPASMTAIADAWPGTESTRVICALVALGHVAFRNGKKGARLVVLKSMMVSTGKAWR